MFLLYPILAALLGVVPLAGTLSLLFLLAVALRKGRSPAPPARLPRLAVVVPAHDEELVLSGTLDSLQSQDYPADLFEVLVVADNCADGTAPLARAHGVSVLERSHEAERGKGYALNFAISYLLAQPTPPDGFVIVDADTWVSPDFLRCLGARLAANTRPDGLGAWQGRYGVLNAGDAWRAGLMAGAFDLVNHVKPLGRDALGLSAGLKGNGMAFTRALAGLAAWPGGSLTEDLDYGLELARRFGLRVAYAPEARVLAQMPQTADQAASQRARWEGGRARLVRERALPLLWEGLHTRSLLLLDSAWDLLVPPLAQLGALALAWSVAVAGGVVFHLLPRPGAWLAAVAFCLLGLTAYVLGGFALSGAGRDTYLALARAPFYVLWKFILLLSQPRRPRGVETEGEWVRTARAPLSPTPSGPAPSAPAAKGHAE